MKNIKSYLLLTTLLTTSACSTAFDKFESLPKDKVAIIKTTSSWSDHFKIVAVDGVNTGSEFMNMLTQDSKGISSVTLPEGKRSLDLFWKGNENSLTTPTLFNTGTVTKTTWQEFNLRCDAFLAGGHSYILEATVDSANNITLSATDEVNKNKVKILNCQNI